jgi:hypothetical protein
MIELPVDFPHKPPENYTYEVEEFKRNVISIWLRDHRKYDYNNGKPVRTIWGFWSDKKCEYYSPVNSKTIGKRVDIDKTTPYSAMVLNLNPLMAAFA